MISRNIGVVTRRASTDSGHCRDCIQYGRSSRCCSAAFRVFEKRVDLFVDCIRLAFLADGGGGEEKNEEEASFHREHDPARRVNQFTSRAYQSTLRVTYMTGASSVV
jgi:hypothetical protein